MANILRNETLEAFKSLHKTVKYVFKGDSPSINKAREQINIEYKKYKNIRDAVEIRKLILHSKSVENELRTTVIQAQETQPGRYEVHLRDEIHRLDNVPFKECSNSQEKETKA